jgi:hypothetical protein
MLGSNTLCVRLGVPPVQVRRGVRPALVAGKGLLGLGLGLPCCICTATGLTPATSAPRPWHLVARNVSCGFVSARCRPPPPLRSVLARPSYHHRLSVSRAPVVGAAFLDGLAAGQPSQRRVVHVVLRCNVLCTLCCAATCCSWPMLYCAATCCSALQPVLRAAADPLTFRS